MAPDRIGPYRIESPLGAGGMGEVYQAFDERLGRRVAIKLVRPEVWGHETGRERFRREARTVASLNHPAIVQIFDVLRWEDRECIVMELVQGEPLSQRLRQGPLSTESALLLAREVAEALAYAHGRDVVHRDLKAENVLLTREGHAKILDFGVSKRLTGTTEVSLSRDGHIIGTLHAMSPEQCQGREVDHRSDLFSLGSLLYQAATGRSPFRGGSAQETLARICVQRQEPAVEVNPQLPAVLSALIDRLLEKDPAERPQTAEEVVAVLERFHGPREAMLPQDSQHRRAAKPSSARGARLPGLTRIAAAALLAAAAAWVWQRSPSPPRPTAAPATAPQTAFGPAALPQRPSVAVTTLRNDSSPPWLSEAIPDLLSAYLRTGQEIRVLRREDVLLAEMELAFDTAGRTTPEDLSRLGEYFGLDRVIAGSFGPGDLLTANGGEPTEGREDSRQREGEGTVARESLHLHLDLFSLPGPRPMASPVARGQDLWELVARAGRQLREGLGLRPLTQAQERRVAGHFPAAGEGQQGYFRGLGHLRRKELSQARPLLQGSASLSPGHPLPLLALAAAYGSGGRAEKARQWASEARQAVDRSAFLTAEEKLYLRARSFQVTAQWGPARDAYQQLFQRFGDDVELGLQFANTQVKAGDLKEGLQTLETLRKRAPRGLQNPQIHMGRTSILYELSSLGEAVQAADRLAEAGERLGSDLLLAKARLRRGVALQGLGRRREAMAALEEAMPLYEASADRSGFASWLHNWGAILYQQGELDSARRLFERALKGYREVGDRLNESRITYNLGGILLWQGRSGEAEAYFLQSRQISLALEAHRNLAFIHSALGTLYLHRGDLPQAQEEHGEARELFEELGDESNAAGELSNLAHVLYYLGDLEGSLEASRRALAAKRALLDKSGQGYAHMGIANVHGARGQYYMAEEEYGRALDIQEGLGERTVAAQTRLALARLKLLQGELPQAKELALLAQEVLTAENLADLAALARALLGSIYLAEGNPEQARSALAEAAARATEEGDRRVRFAVGILAARLAAAAGTPKAVSAALGQLRQIEAEAAQARFVPYELEAGLRLSEMEQALGDSSRARQRLEALATEAEQRGFGQFTKSAALLAQKP